MIIRFMYIGLFSEYIIEVHFASIWLVEDYEIYIHAVNNLFITPKLNIARHHHIILNLLLDTGP